MKYIKNQEVVEIINSETNENVKLQFHKWLISAIHANAIFGKGLKSIMQGAKIVTEVEDQKDAEYIKLEDDDFNKLKESVEICQWVPRMAMKLISFHQSLEGALDKLPETQKTDK